VARSAWGAAAGPVEAEETAAAQLRAARGAARAEAAEAALPFSF